MKGISKSVCVLVLSWLISGTFKTEGYSSSYTEISTEGLSTTEFVTWWSTSIDTTSRYLTTDVPETSSEHSTTVERSTTSDVTTEEITTEGVSTTTDWTSTTTEEDTTTEAIISTTIDWTTTKEDTTTEVVSTTTVWTSTTTEEDTTTEETTTDVVSTTIKSTERYETTTLPTSTHQDVTSTVARPATTFLSTTEVATSTQPTSSTQSTSTSVPTRVGTSRSTEEPTSSTTKAQTSLSTDRTTSDGPSTGFTTMQQSTPTIGTSPSQSAETSRPPSTSTRVTEDASRTSVTGSEPASTDTSETTQSETPHTPIKTTEDVSTVTQTTDETPSDGIYTGSPSTAHITTSLASDMPSTALPMEEISEGGVVAELAVAYEKWDREAFQEAIAVSANIFCRANTSYCYIDDDGSMENITSDDVVIFYADSCANSPSGYDYTCSNVNYTLIGFYISHPTGEGVLMESESLIAMLDEHSEDLEERLGYGIVDTVSYEELPDKEDTGSAFPGWAIFLICVGVVGAGAAAGFGVWYYLKHRHTRRKTAPKLEDGDEASSPDAETGDSLLMEEKAAAVEDNPQNVEASEAPSVANDENIEVEADVAVIMDETKPGSD